MGEYGLQIGTPLDTCIGNVGIYLYKYFCVGNTVYETQYRMTNASLGICESGIGINTTEVVMDTNMFGVCDGTTCDFTTLYVKVDADEWRGRQTSGAAFGYQNHTCSSATTTDIIYPLIENCNAVNATHSVMLSCSTGQYLAVGYLGTNCSGPVVATEEGSSCYICESCVRTNNLYCVYNSDVDTDYCCDYFDGLDTILFSKSKLVKDLSIATLVCNYALVILTGILVCAFRDNLEDSKAVILGVTVLGSLIDICLTFASVGVIDQNDLVNISGNAYNSDCYSGIHDRTMTRLEDQFDSILTIDIIEGCIGLFGLCCLVGGYGFGEKGGFTAFAEGIHAFIFGMLDVALVSVNLFAYVLPTYNAFLKVYEDNQSPCFSVN